MEPNRTCLLLTPLLLPIIIWLAEMLTLLRKNPLLIFSCFSEFSSTWTYYSGETGRGCIVSLAKQTESCDIWAARVLQLTVPEQGIMKYHASSCYRSFQRDAAKTVSILAQPEQSESPEQAQELGNDPTEQWCKRFKPNKCLYLLWSRSQDCQGKNQWPKNYWMQLRMLRPSLHWNGSNVWRK